MYKKILVPVDDPVENTRVLEEAARLGTAVNGATILLLHVVDSLWYSHGMERHSIFVNDVLPAMRRHGYSILDEAHRILAGYGVQAEFQLEECGDRRISEVIIERAQGWGADLIAMGTHGRHGVDRLFMGSVAEGVARASPIPVLLVRPGQSLAAKH